MHDVPPRPWASRWVGAHFSVERESERARERESERARQHAHAHTCTRTRARGSTVRVFAQRRALRHTQTHARTCTPAPLHHDVCANLEARQRLGDTPANYCSHATRGPRASVRDRAFLVGPFHPPTRMCWAQQPGLALTQIIDARDPHARAASLRARRAGPVLDEPPAKPTRTRCLPAKHGCHGSASPAPRSCGRLIRPVPIVRATTFGAVGVAHSQSCEAWRARKRSSVGTAARQGEVARAGACAAVATCACRAHHSLAWQRGRFSHCPPQRAGVVMCTLPADCRRRVGSTRRAAALAPTAAVGSLVVCTSAFEGVCACRREPLAWHKHTRVRGRVARASPSVHSKARANAG